MILRRSGKGKCIALHFFSFYCVTYVSNSLLPFLPSFFFDSHAVMEYEVACVDITPQTEGRDRADLCAVGLWTEISVRLLQLPSLSTMHTQPLGGGKRQPGEAYVNPCSIGTRHDSLASQSAINNIHVPRNLGLHNTIYESRVCI